MSFKVAVSSFGVESVLDLDIFNSASLYFILLICNFLIAHYVIVASFAYLLAVHIC